MIGKVLACTIVGGTTLAVYMVVFNDPEPYPISPPLKPLHIMTNTPTTTAPTMTPLPSVVPDPTKGIMLCPTTSPKQDGTCTLKDWGLPNDPPTTTPTFVPAHPGEIIV